ncbi:MAG: heme exporter protein CcmD [Rhodoferax sp.]
MIWASWSDFWDMGGYGLYVWGSYAVVAIGLLLEVHGAAQRQRRALAQIHEQTQDNDL